MNLPATKSPAPPGRAPEGGLRPGRLGRYVAFTAVLTLGFSPSLWKLFQFAIHNDFFSYIPLIPFLCIYLIRLRRDRLTGPPASSPGWAGLFALAGGAVLAAGLMLGGRRGQLELQDYLAFMTAAYLLLLIAGAFAVFGADWCREMVFPMAMSVFAIPMPTPVMDAVEAFFQYTSAVTAEGMLRAAGMTLDREDLVLHLPTIPLKVNPECSGIHSTLVLAITALLAGWMFLRSPWKRAWLVLAVIPLAILRNGFRIFVIGELCVRIGPRMIDSPIHHHGGPIFFALSLIPFFGLLLYLRKFDAPPKAAGEESGKVPLNA